MKCGNGIEQHRVHRGPTEGSSAVEQLCLPAPPQALPSSIPAAHTPKHFDQSRDASRFEDGQQALPVVGEVVQRPRGAAGRLHVVRVLHGAHDGRHHLRRPHDGVARGLLLGQLMHHNRGLVHHHLQSRDTSRQCGAQPRNPPHKLPEAEEMLAWSSSFSSLVSSGMARVASSASSW